MIEISLWIPVVAFELFVFLVAGGAFVWKRAVDHRHDLKAQIEALEKELAGQDHHEGEEEEAAPDEAVPVAPPSETIKLVLLSQDDVDAATPPVAEAEEGGGTQAPSEADEHFDKLVQTNQGVTNRLDTILERSAELGMKLGELRGTEGLDQAVKDKVQGLIDHMRESDELLVQAADLGVEVDETIRHVKSVGGGGGAPAAAAPAKPVDHVSLNEILMARADGQTEEELAELRDEVRRRLLEPPPTVPADDNQALQAITNQLEEAKSQLANEVNEKKLIQTNLKVVTEEYQRLFEQFQPMA